MGNEYTLSPPRFEANGVDSWYRPCRTGLHVCGQTSQQGDSQPYTALNILYPTPEAAIKAFTLAKHAGECDHEDADYIIDLQINDDCSEDFSTNRQLFPLILRALGFETKN